MKSKNTKKQLLVKIRKYFKEYEKATGEFWGDDETLEGWAYCILCDVADFLKDHKFIR